METKVCRSCEKSLPYSEFYPLKTGTCGLYSYCRSCSRLKQRRPAPKVVDLPGEEWRPVDGWEDFYHVSNMGRVKALPRRTICRNRWGEAVRRTPPRIMKATPTKHFGHLTVGLAAKGRKTKRVLVHRLVCEAFHGPCPEGRKHCAHWDGDPANNKAQNLRWATAAENAADTRRHGNLRQGEESNLSRLTEAQVIEIRERSAAGQSGYSLAKEYGLSATGIYKIINRENWKHI